MEDMAAPLKGLAKNRDFLIGIDSDGCVFDTMEIKHKECFTPNIIYYWNMQCVSKYAREAVEFVNLYSKWRGVNRFPALLKTMELLSARAEVRRRGYVPHDMGPLGEWVKKESKLGNPALKGEVARAGDPLMKKVLEWSLAVNESIEKIVFGVPPFPYVRDCLDMMRERADMIVVSQTPGEALIREWEEHKIEGYARVIAGQEMGTKSEHIRYASNGRYGSGRVLMIGDAPGDQKAAADNGALFYPIFPGDEERSWKLLRDEALEKFFRGEYAGAYERDFIEEFNGRLPETPPWDKVNN